MRRIRRMRTPWYVKAKAEMKAQGLVLADLAEVLGITVSAVGHYLNGRRTPSVEQVQKIAGILGMSVSELCGEDAYFIIDSQERKIIDLIRNMPDATLETAVMLLTALNNSNKGEKKPE